ncbi:UDP-N-acetylmuramate--L-alanine ligase [Deinococcus aquiradiocola]|uniref:UDP-N-acetylmuramate--L-alanine ligase n=2 Tax=Deinococcus aquiradiocola TaxID=393059 RepID=A0A917UPX8_9DEIO|nr:UDP-N-acetylmuramate--L-alanine ligase [Deinococcus aquiradiocola]
MTKSQTMTPTDAPAAPPEVQATAGAAVQTAPVTPPAPTPARPTHFHLMGIGGIGLSAFARILRARGFTVSGCDSAPSELTHQLQLEGTDVLIGHGATHLSGVDVLIASEAVSRTHPEIVAAREAGIEVRPRMALMEELLAGGPSVGVVGTHGKTTTTSMTAVAMYGAGLDPAAFVGGIIPAFGSNARAGQGPFVAEIDESDQAFQTLRCETAVFLNADDDHIGTPGKSQAVYWETVEDQHAAFGKFVTQAARVLYCHDWPGLPDFLSPGQPSWSYGLNDGADYRATDLNPDPEGTDFTVVFRGEALGRARVAMPGLHNVQNAVAALATTHLYGGNFALAAAALAEFGGPRRRWERVGTLDGAIIIDDYAHNAAKVAAVVGAARQTGRRVRIVFQPHRYLRTQQSWPRLADSLMPADEVILLDIAAAGEEAITGIDSTLIVNRMYELGHRGVHYLPLREEVLTYLRGTVQPGDVIVTVGAGDVWKIGRELAGVSV